MLPCQCWTQPNADTHLQVVMLELVIESVNIRVGRDLRGHLIWCRKEAEGQVLHVLSKQVRLGVFCVCSHMCERQGFFQNSHLNFSPDVPVSNAWVLFLKWIQCVWNSPLSLCCLCVWIFNTALCMNRLWQLPLLSDHWHLPSHMPSAPHAIDGSRCTDELFQCLFISRD